MTDRFSHTVDKRVSSLRNDRISTIHEYSLDTESNQIYLMGEESYYYGTEEPSGEPGVEYSMANKFIKNLNILMRKSDAPILIHLKTCGGFWAEGMAIYDTIKACPNYIIMLVYTHARSMSSLILQSADKRVMLPHATYMFHQGTLSLIGTYKQVINNSNECRNENEQMMKIYIDTMKKSGIFSKKSKTFIKDWLNEQMNKREDVYFSASEAVKYGFADEVFGANGIYNWKKLLET